MKATRTHPAPGEKKFVSRVDAIAVMVAATVAAGVTSFLTATGIVETFTGPVTLSLPVHSAPQSIGELSLGSVGRFTGMEATIPVLPTGEATLLAWAAALSQISFLAVMALLFMLAFRLRTENLFTSASAWIVGSCGVVLALAGTLAQALNAAARSQIAELIGANGPGSGETVGFVWDVNIAPLVAGTVLVLIAGVFQLGRRFQKDTEGLI